MKSKITYPSEISTEYWHGGILHKINLCGTVAWIVEPPMECEKKYWFWLPEWPTAFPERNGVKELIQMGFYMVHIDVYGKFANEEAVKTMYSFYEYLQALSFEKKGAFIGMSMGGLYTFRFVETYPETANCIYADAPVCDLYWRHNRKIEEQKEVSCAYGLENDTEALKNHPLSPLNNYRKMVENNIPLLMVLGLADQVVPADENGLVMVDLWRKAGGKAELIARDAWGHHPHGLDSTGKILRFITENTFKGA